MKAPILLCILASITAAATLTVAPEGAQYTTIQAAATAAYPGDTVLIAPGVYAEELRPPRSGTSDAPITYCGTGDGAVLDGGDGSRSFAMDIADKHHLHFATLTFRGGKWGGIRLNGASGNITFDHITVCDNNHPDFAWSYGIHIDAKDAAISNIALLNSEICRNRGHGLYIQNRVEQLLVDSCHIHHNGHSFTDTSDNIIIADWDSTPNGPQHIEIRNSQIDNATRQGLSTWNVSDLYIHHNHFHNNGATAVQIEDGTVRFMVEHNHLELGQHSYNTETGVWIDDADLGTVRHNLINDNQVGIKVSKSDRIVVRHNSVLDCRRPNAQHLLNSGITILSYDSVANRRTAVVHNSFRGIGTVDAGFLNSAISLFEGVGSTNRELYFVNNIFAEADEAFYLNSYSGNGDTLTYHANHNLLWNAGDRGVNVQGNESSLDQWFNWSGTEQQSLQADPLFRAHGVALHPQSPAIDAGGALTVVTQSSGGNQITVAEALYFSDGYGLTGGDTIVVAGREAIVTALDHDKGTLTLDRSLSAVAGDPVSFPFHGTAPDIGAIETAATSAAPHLTSASTPFQPNQFTLYDVRGRVLVQEPLSTERALQAHTRALAPGIYIAQWRSEQGAPLHRVLHIGGGRQPVSP